MDAILPHVRLMLSLMSEPNSIHYVSYWPLKEQG